MQKEDIDVTDKELLDYYAAESRGLDQKVCKNCTFINKPGDRICDVC